MNVAGHAVKRRRNRVGVINLVRLWAVLLLGFTSAGALADSSPSSVEEVNTVYLTEWGLAQPAALTYSPQYGHFYIVEQKSSEASGEKAEIVVVTPDGEIISKVALPDSAVGTHNIAVDRAGNRLFVLDATLTGLVQIQLGEDGVPDPASAVRHDISRLGLASANGMTMHADGQVLLFLDGKSSKVLSLYLEDEEEQADVAEVSLPAELAGADLRGLATHPETGDLFVLNGSAQRLYELASTGELVKEYDVSSLELKSPQGIVLAPSVDSTDEPETIHLFVVDSGKVPSPPTQTGGGRLFIPFVPGFHSQGVLQAEAPAAPVGKFVEASLEETIPAPVGVAATALTYVQTVETSQFSPPSPDASGITYIPNAQILLITDGEVEEMSIYAGANIFGVRLSNVRVNVPEYTYTTLPYKATEPTDAAFNPNNGHIFYSDDDARKIFEVNPGPDGRHGTSDDSVRSFATNTFGSGDPEGLSYDPASGDLFIADGADKEIYRLSPGPNGVFNGIVSGSDDTWSSIDTGRHAIEDPEGVHFEPSTGNLIVTGKSKVLIFELTTAGDLVQTFDVSAAVGAKKLAGVVQAPSSRDPNKSSFYIVDRMVDNGSNPNENDGRMYEFELPTQQPATVFVQFEGSTYTVSESGVQATIGVKLSQSSSQVVTVNYSTANGTAAAGSDYTAASGTLTFNPGETSKSFSVPITNDTLDEPNETVSLSLSSPSNATLGSPSSATLTITDNDAAPTVQFSSATYTVDEGGGNATITVNLSAASGQEVKVNYATANGTATSGSDYTAASGTLTFAAGETSKSFNVPIANDTQDEPNETVNLALTNPVNATLGSPNSATLTITDNDSAPTVQFSSAAYTAGENGGSATITVNLNGPSGQTVTVQYATADGTAAAGSDYTATSGTLTFNPGETSKSFSVPITNDGQPEPDETVSLSLSSPSNATLGSPNTATLTITDAATTPTVQFSSATYTVDEGGGNATITVNLSAASGQSVSVNYATANGSAQAGSDYTAASGTLTFNPSVTSLTFQVPIVNDTQDEPDETVSLSLSNPSNATLGTPNTATLTITDNDEPPPAGEAVILLSPAAGVTLAGVVTQDEDIVSYDTGSGTFAMYFDGTDVGLGTTDVIDFEVLADGSLLMTFREAISISGLGQVETTDIVRFVPTTLGPDTTGTFEWYLDGSDVGLDNTSNEGLDSVGLTADGKLLLSTVGSFNVPGASGTDEDLFLYTPAQVGADSSGSFEFYFDGSDVGLADTGDEDIDSVWLDINTGEIYLITRAAFSVAGVSGTGGDIFVCTPISLGSDTSCSFRLYWDASTTVFGTRDADGLWIDLGG